MDGTFKLLSLMLVTLGITFGVSHYHAENAVNETSPRFKQTTKRLSQTTATTPEAAENECNTEEGCNPIDPEAFMNATELINSKGTNFPKFI